MTVGDETRRVVESYFAAWTTKDVRAAHALLAGDLEFSGPTASYQSADAFLPALVKFAEMTKWARIVDLVVEGNRAALLSREEDESLLRGRDVLAAAVDLLTPALPDDLQP